jgi:chromatin remodeling complex protein RSC6
MAPKKNSKAPAATEAVPAPATETVVDTPASEVVVEKDAFTVVLEKLQAVAADVKEMIAQVKTLQKDHAKLVKSSTKRTKKSVSAGGQRTLSGFAKPSQLSAELCTFIGVTPGTSMARTEVTRAINEYIKKNNLQDASDKRHILPDAALTKILNLTAEDKLTYFNLQKFLKHHFTK